MRSLIAMVFGLLLLVSAAAATGSNNNVVTVVTEDATGTCLTGADFVQTSTLDANTLGCDNDIAQNMFLVADDNSLVGTRGLFGEGEIETGHAAEGEFSEEGSEEFTGVNFVQAGKMMLNTTGSGALDTQDVDLVSVGNCQTFGNFTQFASQVADDLGCDNAISQDSDVLAGDIEGINESAENSFVMSNTMQAQALDVCAVGSDNDLDQHAEQDLFDSCATRSTIDQTAILTEDVWGCGNSNDLEAGIGETEHGQSALQVVDDSDFTRARATQGVSLNWQALGSDNAAAQFGETIIDDDCVTMGVTTQSISEIYRTLGCDNAADQDAILTNVDNSIVGGRMVQTTTINTND